MIALLGNLARDLFPDRPPAPGGAPYHAARALRSIDTPGVIYARCAEEDREELVPPVARLGTPVRYVPGRSTASFLIAYEGHVRSMGVEAAGDTWLPEDVPELPPRVRWVHVAPLLRSDFPAGTLAAIARGRRLSLDGQGLVRAPELGPLRLDADYDPAMLAHVAVLKLAEEEAEVLGDPAALPVPEVLVTHGPVGATVYAEGRCEHVHAFEVDADPTGAGDAFSIAYVAARAAGLPPMTAARRATGVVAEMLAASLVP
ncbi:MAG TPA: PfkB family carbohydrate kinase [Gaiellaceae bacterium]|nr:PfkB family carbohydrate kinase [Gaiellaceae bacterium]